MSLIPKEQYLQILKQLPIACVDVLIVYEGKCLLLLRDNEPAINTWWFPGGRIYKNETIINAALRKAKEETNLECEFQKIISTEESIFEKTENMETDIHTINICCLMTINDISKLSKDHLHIDCKWINKLDKQYHSAVNNPLSLLGYKY